MVSVLSDPILAKHSEKGRLMRKPQSGLPGDGRIRQDWTRPRKERKVMKGRLSRQGRGRPTRHPGFELWVGKDFVDLDRE